MLRNLAFACAMIVLAGCGYASNQSSVYAGTGHSFDLVEPGVQPLGPVTAVAGMTEDPDTHKSDWPMGLRTQPPAETYQYAIRKKAAAKFGVDEHQIVIGEIKVGYDTEPDGTIRGWKATAVVGKKGGY